MALEGSGVQSWRAGGVGMNWLVVLTLPNFFDLPFSSQGDFFLWSLKNMSVSFRVKDQCQAAFHCPVYSGVGLLLELPQNTLDSERLPDIDLSP